MIAFSRRAFLWSALLSGCAALPRPRQSGRAGTSWLGYTEYRTNLPTRYENQVTSRACIVRSDGSGRRVLGDALITGPNTWTQFAGWSPGETDAIILGGWESPDNGAWEEEHKTFRMTEGWKLDIYFCDIHSGALTNLTAVERVSEYNSGLVFVPGNSGDVMFTALINGVSHPFLMKRDGTNKRDMSQGKEGFIYGVNPSPDGQRVAYHKDYQIMVADADGANLRHIETGNPFNFVPQWSPDGRWLLFVSGEHYNCHPYIVRPDGSGLRKIADRGGYDGVTKVYDVFDFHGGSSDVPAWSVDGQSVYYTAKIADCVELMNVALDGETRQLSRSGPGVVHYHPKPSPDGKSLAFGSTRSGNRQIYIMPAAGAEPWSITRVPAGYGAMWAYWGPSA